jgi:two-component sensor histidine kinase
VGRGLEAGTYATLILSYTLLALFAAWTRVESGSIALAGPAWLYVGGAAFYAALWWGSFVAAARWLSARYPIRQASWRRGVAMHAAGALLVAILNGIAYFPYQWYAVEGGSVVLGIASHWAWGDLAVYPTLAGIAHGFIYAREYHAKRLSELRLRSLLAESELQRTEAELQALKAELNPHFLFNALNTVSSLMHTRVDDARRVVAHLSALLRRVLESGSLQEVSVEEEVEFIRLYLEIEQARFGDALRIVYRLDPATLRARVPHLLIQPLVENAVKHGLRPRDGTGQVMLSSERVGDFLQLMVADDGVGPGHTPRAEGTGTGLANVRQRLRQLYGEHQSFELAPAPSGGATASIRIPFTEHPRTAPA